MQRTALFFSLLLTGLAAKAGDAPAFATDIKPVLETHCVGCHNPKKKKGGVDLSLAVDEKNTVKLRKLLTRAYEQVETGEMPPDDGKELSAAQKKNLLAWSLNAQTAIDLNDPAYKNPGKALVRRMNRNEYNLALRDLTGLELDVATAVGIPEDTVTTGYDNLATSLMVPPALMEKFFAGSDRILDELFLEKDGKKVHAKEFDTIVFVKPSSEVPEGEAARKIIERFASRAYRRPLVKEEFERFTRIYNRVDAKPNRFEVAVRWMLKSVLVSPNFLMRVEEDRALKGSKDPAPLSQYELATRLSFFLWSSIPDAELRKTADENKLNDPVEFEKQVRRMLADPKARALTDNFGGQWLQLRKLATARPSTEFFPNFTPDLKHAMYEETALFFDALRTEDGNLLKLLDADFSYLNEELAEHYGIPGVKGKQMRRVALPAGGPRGGLTGMASMLSLTSHTHRTSPTLRGKYILEVVLGSPPPPPPANASQLKEEHEAGKEPKSFREQLAQHASDATCAACHKRIDPMGFGLENFDAIGRWRDSYGGQPVDSTGTLPGGVSFRGASEMKKVLLSRKDQFIHNAVEQTLLYALGRELKWYDDGTIFSVKRALEKDNYKFSTLILGIVKSPQFMTRKNSDAPEE